MILEELPVRIHCRKIHDDAFALEYYCPSTGALRRIPTKKSGQFVKKEDALEWASENVRHFVSGRISFLERQRWRLNSSVLKHFIEYSAWRKQERVRSASRDLSMVQNYVLPFFVTAMKLNDPNRWGEFGEEFVMWLQKEAKTLYGFNLAIATSNQAIGSANQFLKWMRRKKIIEYQNYRPFEFFESRKLPRRDFKDLVSDEVFKAVGDYLKTKNELYADMWCVQRNMGFRMNELLGLPFHSLSDECPRYVREEFEAKGMKIAGSVYLESQPTKPYVKREINGSIGRSPLKGRIRIGVEFSRTIPILDVETWEILVRRYEKQCSAWDEQLFGEAKDSYLLFDGAHPKQYRDLIREAYASMGLESPGTHMLRHTLSTDWTAYKISEKVAELVLGHKASAHQMYVHIVAQVNSERTKAAPMPRLRKNVEN